MGQNLGRRSTWSTFAWNIPQDYNNINKESNQEQTKKGLLELYFDGILIDFQAFAEILEFEQNFFQEKLVI